MSDPETSPKLNPELQQALDASDGVVQGQSFILMRTDIVLDWFGYTKDELRGKLQPAIEQAERGDLAEWNLQDFLAEMHRQHDAKTG